MLIQIVNQNGDILEQCNSDEETSPENWQERTQKYLNKNILRYEVEYNKNVTLDEGHIVKANLNLIKVQTIVLDM